MAWTQDRVEELKSLWKDGLSASAIAAELGGFDHCGDRGRSAVLGKVHRMGLDGRHTTTVVPRKPRSKNQTISPLVIRRMQQARRQPEIQPVPEPEEIYTTEHMCRMDRLEYNNCRWPLWTSTTPFSDQFYCGMPTANVYGGRPYCAHHADGAFDGLPKRKAKKPDAPPPSPFMEAAE